ncbi:MAG: hypothetical protein F4Y58_00200 [Gammaproteobacteria bacterium]|nr:hypothetical protein [Gammaproteobacteria bacterium]
MMKTKGYLLLLASVLALFAMALPAVTPPAGAEEVCGVENRDKTPPCVQVRHKNGSLHGFSKDLSFDCPTRPNRRTIVLKHNDAFQCKGTRVVIHIKDGTWERNVHCTGYRERGRLDWQDSGSLTAYC